MYAHDRAGSHEDKTEAALHIDSLMEQIKEAGVERADRDYLYGLEEIPSDKNVCHSCKQDIGNDAGVRIDGRWMHVINEDCTAALYRAAEAGEFER